MSADDEVDYSEDIAEQTGVSSSVPQPQPATSVGNDAMEEVASGYALKGRGHKKQDDREDRYNGRGGVFERLESSGGAGPMESIEGWIIFVTNIHQEAQEDDILDKFSDFGDVKNVHVNLDRRTGFVKGYALIEFEKKEEAQAAIRGMDGKELLGQTVHVSWAFMKK